MAKRKHKKITPAETEAPAEPEPGTTSRRGARRRRSGAAPASSAAAPLSPAATPVHALSHIQQQTTTDRRFTLNPQGNDAVAPPCPYTHDNPATPAAPYPVTDQAARPHAADASAPEAASSPQ